MSHTTLGPACQAPFSQDTASRAPLEQPRPTQPLATALVLVLSDQARAIGLTYRGSARSDARARGQIPLVHKLSTPRSRGYPQFPNNRQVASRERPVPAKTKRTPEPVSDNLHYITNRSTCAAQSHARASRDAPNRIGAQRLQGRRNGRHSRPFCASGKRKRAFEPSLQKLARSDAAGAALFDCIRPHLHPPKPALLFFLAASLLRQKKKTKPLCGFGASRTRS